MTSTTEKTEWLMSPTVHMNGTSREALMEGLSNALYALQAAHTAISEAGPNGRDYYPQGPEAIYTAVRQHQDRLTRLASIMDEIQEIAEATDA